MKYIKPYAALLLVFLTLFFCACGKNNTPAPEMTETVAQYSVSPTSETQDEKTRLQTAAESETDTQTSAEKRSETAVRSSAAEKTSAAVKTTEKQTAAKTETATSAPSTTKQHPTKVRSTRRSSGRNEKTEVSESATETSVTESEISTVPSTSAKTTSKTKVRPAITPAGTTNATATTKAEDTAKPTATAEVSSTTKPTTTTKAASTTKKASTTKAAASTKQKVKTVHVKIICTNAVKYGVKDIKLPENGIMADCEVPYTEGMTAMDALKAAAKLKGIEVDESHGYVRGIGGLYEKDCSGSSGWLYNVNGEYPNVACDKYKLNENDTMTFIYTAEQGDVKMN